MIALSEAVNPVVYMMTGFSHIIDDKKANITFTGIHSPDLKSGRKNGRPVCAAVK
jgi:hypothetical protein